MNRPRVPLPLGASIRLQVLDVNDGTFLSNDGSSTIIICCLTESNSSPSSVMLLVEDFRPYLYFPVSQSFSQNSALNHNIQEFTESLGVQLEGNGHEFEVSIVAEAKQPLLYHRVNRQNYSRFLRINCKNSSTLAKIDSVLQSAKERSSFNRMFADGRLYDDMVYESNVSLSLRFMIDTQISGGSWISVPRNAIDNGDQTMRDETRQEQAARGWQLSFDYVLRLRSHREIISHSNSSHIRLLDAEKCRFQRIPMAITDMANSKLRVMSVDICRFSKSVTSSGEDEDSRSPSSPAPQTPVAKQKKRRLASTQPRTKPDDSIEYDLVAITSVFYEGPTIQSRRTLCHRALVGDVLEESGTVQLFESEVDLVIAWLQSMREFDPDVLEGYELATCWSWIRSIISVASSLDLGRVYASETPFTVASSSSGTPKRSKHIRTRQRIASKLLRQGRSTGTSSSPAGDLNDDGSGGDSATPSRPRVSAPSNRAFHVVDCMGRVLLDIRQVMEHEELMSTYGFGEIVRRFLHRETEILDEFTLRRILSNQTAPTTALEEGGPMRAVRYWQTRCERMFAVVEESKILLSLIELARITGVNISDVMLRGQMVRFQSQLLQFCRKSSYLLPSPTRHSVAGMSEGALNLMPEIGYYTKEPVAVLDFKSLYPSIIIAYNMCFSTVLLYDEDVAAVGKDSYHSLCYSSTKEPEQSQINFVRPSIKHGIIPGILEYLIDERKHLRQQLTDTADPALRLVLDTRQKAVKICANSVYGALGSPKSFLPFMNLANAVVLTGARMLQTLSEQIPRRFAIESDTKALAVLSVDKMGKSNQLDRFSDNHLPVKVIYGDTDSVFVAFPGSLSIEHTIICAKQICENLNGDFPHPICLDFEQVLFPSLFLQRKRYAGLSWKLSPGQAAPEIISRGIETNRRDSCPIVAEIMEKILQLMLWPSYDTYPVPSPSHEVIIDHETQQQIRQRVVDYLTGMVDRITGDQIDLGAFIMTKGLWLGTDEQDYRTKQAHVELAQKIKQRQQRELAEGERISYVFVKGTGTAARLAYEKVETVDYAVKNNLPLDYTHYIEHQLRRPISRVISSLLSDTELNAIFTVRKTATISTPSPVKGTITKYFSVIQTKCFGCKTKLAPGKHLCDECREKQRRQERQILLTERTELENVCHQCQGDNRLPILCTNQDCRVYFSRLKNAAKISQHSIAFTKDLNW